MQRSQLRALLLAVAAVAVAARPQRELQQVTVFYDTPGAAGSTSLDVNGNLGLRPDGTVQAAAGGSVASSNAISNPLLNILTQGAYKNRPEASSTAYTQIPLLMGATAFPTLSYGAAESKGDLLSQSNGIWGNAEFGYNPLNNNLGASVSSGTTGSANILSSDSVGGGPGAGNSGVKFAGYSNDLTTLADARTDQSGQATAFPYNILQPYGTLTCTQALLYAVTFSQYDLGAPVSRLPREDGPTSIPFCLNLFNFATLDDFEAFVNNSTLAEKFLVPSAGVDANSTTIDVAASEEEVTVTPGATLEPLPGPEEDGMERSAAKPANGSAPATSRQSRPTPTFASTITDALTGAPDAIRQLASSPLFQDLLERASKGPVATAFDGMNELVAKQAARVTERMAGPAMIANQAMSNITRALVTGAGNTAMKGAVAAIELAEPVLAAGSTVARAVQPAAKASRAAAAKMAQQTEQKLDQTVKSLPADVQKEVRAAQAAASAESKQAAAKPAQAQMGRRMML